MGRIAAKPFTSHVLLIQTTSDVLYYGFLKSLRNWADQIRNWEWTLISHWGTCIDAEFNTVILATSRSEHHSISSSSNQVGNTTINQSIERSQIEIINESIGQQATNQLNIVQPRWFLSTKIRNIHFHNRWLINKIFFPASSGLYFGQLDVVVNSFYLEIEQQNHIIKSKLQRFCVVTVDESIFVA